MKSITPSSDSKLPIGIREDLFSENAQLMGFIWHSDKIFDPDAPQEATAEFYQWIEEGGVIGQAANPNFNDFAVGLYEPLESDQKTKARPATENDQNWQRNTPSFQ